MDGPEDRHIKDQLRPGETVRALVHTTSSHVLVTDERIAVADERRLALDLAISDLRRIQFDIERDRPATLVIVPETPTNEPQVLAIPPEHYESAAQALAFVGRRLSDLAEAS
jgi:hypothetical protein